MPIQWFPGHMTKALREMENELKNVDVILYLLDARAPMSSLNPKLSNLAKNKKIVYILNKADLVESSDLTPFKNKLLSQNSAVVSLNSTQTNSTKNIASICKNLMKEKIDAKKNFSISYSIKCMVVGIPNVGKSTLINNLCGKSKTETGNKPGVTRGKQWVTTKNGLTLLDTPGTLWPAFENNNVAYRLAYIGSIKEEVLDIVDLAYYFIKDMLPKYKQNFVDRYNIQICEDDTILEIFEKICIARKCLLKADELDFERCAKLILDDFRKGKLGKIMLDSPFFERN